MDQSPCPQASPTSQHHEVIMSRFLVGIIELNISRTCDGKYSKKFDSCLYKIQQIGIDQKLSILMGGNVPRHTFDDIKEDIPIRFKDQKNIVEIMIARSPEDNTSDDLFNDWACEAWRESYVPGEAKVFKELENFFEQVFALEELKSIWIRYQCMYRSNLYKLEAFTNLEAKFYNQCSDGNIFEISDFEIYKEK